jgi:hypothetical protein
VTQRIERILRTDHAKMAPDEQQRRRSAGVEAHLASSRRITQSNTVGITLRLTNNGATQNVSAGSQYARSAWRVSISDVGLEALTCTSCLCRSSLVARRRWPRSSPTRSA